MKRILDCGCEIDTETGCTLVWCSEAADKSELIHDLIRAANQAQDRVQAARAEMRAHLTPKD